MPPKIAMDSRTWAAGVWLRFEALRAGATRRSGRSPARRPKTGCGSGPAMAATIELAGGARGPLAVGERPVGPGSHGSVTRCVASPVPGPELASRPGAGAHLVTANESFHRIDAQVKLEICSRAWPRHEPTRGGSSPIKGGDGHAAWAAGADRDLGVGDRLRGLGHRRQLGGAERERLRSTRSIGPSTSG